MGQWANRDTTDGVDAGDLRRSALNLLQNCAGARPGESLLILAEDPKLGYYGPASPKPSPRRPRRRASPSPCTASASRRMQIHCRPTFWRWSRRRTIRSSWRGSATSSGFGPCRRAAGPSSAMRSTARPSPRPSAARPTAPSLPSRRPSTSFSQEPGRSASPARSARISRGACRPPRRRRRPRLNLPT